MVTVTIPSDLEKVLTEQADQKGTTVERFTLDVLQERFLSPSSTRQPPETQAPEGDTLADALADFIGAINTHDKYPEGSTLSENTGRKFARSMGETRKQANL